MPARRFGDPPITEVVCGILFDPIDALDPVAVGRFWEGQHFAFPGKQLQPAVVGGPAEGLVLELAPVPPLRTWLLSGDDSRVMQIQSDRFYLNWRARGGRYPSFNDRTNEPGTGLLVEVLARFTEFSKFLKEKLSETPRIQKVEMSMIDVLRQGRHWGSVSDLQQVLPCLQPFLRNALTLPLASRILVEGPTPRGHRKIILQQAKHRVSGADAYRLETTAWVDVASEAGLADAFRSAHANLKQAFDELIPPDEHHRFDRSDWRPTT